MRKFKLTKKQGTHFILAILLILVWVMTGKLPQEIFPANYLSEPTPTPVISQSIVARVIDGDTVVLGNGAKVRYIGIDTPERGECYYQEATEANKKLVLNKKVRLVQDVSTTDKYGRLLRYVYVDGKFVNEYLVRHGYATVSTYPPDVANQELFLEAERRARVEKVGAWSKDACTN